MPGFKASKDRLTLWLGAKAAGNLKLQPVLFTILKNLRPLKNYAKSTLVMLYKWKNKAWMRARLCTTWFTEYFKRTVETYCSEERFLSKYYCSLKMYLVNQEL